MALPPRLFLLPEEGELPLESNRFQLGGSGFGYVNLERELRVLLLPLRTRVRTAWWTEGGDHGSVTVWLEQVKPGRAYEVRLFGEVLVYRAVAAPKFEPKPVECVWLPARPWEPFFWTQLRRRLR